jgi:hypothetical protein
MFLMLRNGFLCHAFSGVLLGEDALAFCVARK